MRAVAKFIVAVASAREQVRTRGHSLRLQRLQSGPRNALRADNGSHRRFQVHANDRHQLLISREHRQGSAKAPSDFAGDFKYELRLASVARAHLNRSDLFSSKQQFRSIQPQRGDSATSFAGQQQRRSSPCSNQNGRVRRYHPQLCSVKK